MQCATDFSRYSQYVLIYVAQIFLCYTRHKRYFECMYLKDILGIIILGERNESEKKEYKVPMDCIPHNIRYVELSLEIQWTSM